MIKTKLRILDVFCGRGGAAMGMIQAGAEVIGVDIDPKCGDYYPGEFHVGRFEDIEKIVTLDGTRLLDQHFDLLWFSCPCQFATSMRAIRGKHKKHVNYIPAARRLAEKLGLPYIIENVPPAAHVYHAMRADVELCGLMFGLDLYRHRVFEIGGFTVEQPVHVDHTGQQQFSVVGRLVSTKKNGGHDRYEAMKKAWPAAMGIFHIPLNITTWDGHNAFSEAIPPAFSKYLVEQFIQNSSMIQSLA